MKGKISVLVSALLLTACDSASDVASRNLSQSADNFEVNRRIVFINTVTDKYLFSIEGLCSKDNSSSDHKLAITCKVGPNSYKKHFLGLSENVTYLIEQLEPAPVNTYQYRVSFRPTTIVPDVDMHLPGSTR